MTPEQVIESRKPICRLVIEWRKPGTDEYAADPKLKPIPIYTKQMLDGLKETLVGAAAYYLGLSLFRRF